VAALWLAVGVAALVATLLPLCRRGAWWIRVLDFPRLQLAVVAAAALGGFLFAAGAARLPEQLFVAALGACVAWHAYMIAPYTPLARKQVEDSRRAEPEASCRLVFANVQMQNRNAARLLEILRGADPDVILVVEADRWWQERLRDLERTHPHSVQHPLDNTYGMLLFSRLALVEPRVEFLIEDDIPSIHTRLRLPNGVEVALHCLHPRPPFPTEAERSTERDAELLVVGRRVKAAQRPAIVMGDLNDVAWSHTNYLFQDISGLLDPRIGRGFFNTFHAKLPGLRFPLDHFFHSDHFRLLELRRLPRFGSDHFPVCVGLAWEPQAAREQEEPEAEGAQQREAGERIEQATLPRPREGPT